MKKNFKKLQGPKIFTLVFGSNWTGDVPVSSGTGAGNTSTINSDEGVATSAALTTAAGAIATVTVTNNRVKATSIVKATISGTTATTGIPVLVSAVPTTNTLTIKILNADGAAAFNGTVSVSFSISQPIV